MLWLILLSLFLIIYFIYLCCTKKYKLWEKIISFFVSIMVCLILYSLLNLLSEAIYFVKYHKQVEYISINTEQIYSADFPADDTNSFSVKLGKFGNELYYIYTVKTDLGLQLSKISSKDCLMKYTTEMPQLVKMRGVIKTNKWFDRDEQVEVTSSQYVLYVPENTIIKNFEQTTN